MDWNRWMPEWTSGKSGAGHEPAAPLVREGIAELAAVERARCPRLPHDEGTRRPGARRQPGDNHSADSGGACGYPIGFRLRLAPLGRLRVAAKWHPPGLVRLAAAL